MQCIYTKLGNLFECEPTLKFITYVNRLIEIMSVRNAIEGLKPKSREFHVNNIGV